MNLRDYLLEKNLTQAAFGQQISPPVSQGKVNHWLQGTRRISLLEALQIQRLTCGVVTVEDLAAQSRVVLEPGHKLLAVDITLQGTQPTIPSPFTERRVFVCRADDRKRLVLDIPVPGQGV